MPATSHPFEALTTNLTAHSHTRKSQEETLRLKAWSVSVLLHQLEVRRVARTPPTNYTRYICASVKGTVRVFQGQAITVDAPYPKPCVCEFRDL